MNIIKLPGLDPTHTAWRGVSNLWNGLMEWNIG